MNPEFQRNLWLELTPRRVVLLTVFIVLALMAASTIRPLTSDPRSSAITFYYFFVVVWGTRNAALSVIGEIRDRTWDLQRLSSLTPAAMTWGKLFGSTVSCWYGGALCLAVFVASIIASGESPVAALGEAVYPLLLGIVAQGVAFLAALLAVRRRETQARLDIFLCQIAGLAAAAFVSLVWRVAPAETRAADAIVWWGHAFDVSGFLLVSLVVFAGWILVGCYRQMRLELMVRNGPAVWLAFMAFIGIYAAGFGGYVSSVADLAAFENASRLLLTTCAFAALTYVMVFLEPKDRVRYRWLLDRARAGDLGVVARGAQAWMMSYAATLIFAAVLVLMLAGNPDPLGVTVKIIAAAGFLTRDVALFLFVQTLPGRRRGDVAALTILVALYLLIPSIFMSLGWRQLVFLLRPDGGVSWLGPAAAWVEGIVMAVVTVRRLGLRETGSAVEAAAA